MARVLVAMTGASGVIYGVRLVQRLVGGAGRPDDATPVPEAAGPDTGPPGAPAADAPIDVDVVLSAAARQVLAIEHGIGGDPAGWCDRGGPVPTVHDNDDITAPPASGSRVPDAMIVVPCSMGTAARLASGLATCLLERAADVVLKEGRRLVLVPRETPLSTIHLRNLLTLSEVGARIVPAMPAFYTRPDTVEDLIAFVVDRALQAAGLDLPLRHVWRGEAPAASRRR